METSPLFALAIRSENLGESENFTRRGTEGVNHAQLRIIITPNLWAKALYQRQY
jgi:hypothetical protein